jgi:hypothetical protein
MVKELNIQPKIFIMIPQFEHLSPSEKELMYDAIPLVTILIACADGELTHQERNWAEKITKIRSYSYHESLREYYFNVGKNYQEKLDYFLEKFPLNIDRRTAMVSEKLSGLNVVLPKLEKVFAWRFYAGLLSFARHVARSSGGFLGWSAINEAERKLIGLDMINPVELRAERQEEST